MRTAYEIFCLEEYKSLFDKIFAAQNATSKTEDKRRLAQKQAIREASINAISKFPEIEPSDIWKTIYVAHVYNVSKIDNTQIINSVISADNSWKKSSGHAFEEMIKELGNLSLNTHNIEILLQKDLHQLIISNQISNEVRDISWLKEQIKSSIFDLYLTLKLPDGQKVFGCVQSKTSIRDRVTRDREPSINAMKAFFLSVAIVLDGAFLKLPKFTNMVNGNSTEYEINGWHGMYVLTNDDLENNRIHKIDITMNKFVKDVVEASQFWINNRQWFDHNWKPSNT